MRSVKLSPAAIRDLARLGDFLVEKSPKTAFAAVEDIRAASSHSGNSPSGAFRWETAGVGRSSSPSVVTATSSDIA